MPPTIGLLILGLALFSISLAAVYKKQSCVDFSKGSTFSSDQAVGVWYLLQLQPSNDPGDNKCVQFAAVNDQERQELEARIGKYAKDLKWDRFMLKMQVPCVGADGYNNKTRNYYLEKLDVDGLYNAVLVPSTTGTTLVAYSSYFNDRHDMQLKLVKEKYLAMIDCKEHFTFLLDKQPHEKELEPELLEILQPYLPEQH